MRSSVRCFLLFFIAILVFAALLRVAIIFGKREGQSRLVIPNNNTDDIDDFENIAEEIINDGYSIKLERDDIKEEIDGERLEYGKSNKIHKERATPCNNFYRYICDDGDEKEVTKSLFDETKQYNEKIIDSIMGKMEINEICRNAIGDQINNGISLDLNNHIKEILDYLNIYGYDKNFTGYDLEELLVNLTLLGVKMPFSLSVEKDIVDSNRFTLYVSINPDFLYYFNMHNDENSKTEGDTIEDLKYGTHNENNYDEDNIEYINHERVKTLYKSFLNIDQLDSYIGPLFSSYIKSVLDRFNITMEGSKKISMDLMDDSINIFFDYWHKHPKETILSLFNYTLNILTSSKSNGLEAFNIYEYINTLTTHEDNLKRSFKPLLRNNNGKMHIKNTDAVQKSKILATDNPKLTKNKPIEENNYKNVYTSNPVRDSVQKICEKVIYRIATSDINNRFIQHSHDLIGKKKGLTTVPYYITEAKKLLNSVVNTSPEIISNSEHLDNITKNNIIKKLHHMKSFILKDCETYNVKWEDIVNEIPHGLPSMIKLLLLYIHKSSVDLSESLKLLNITVKTYLNDQDMVSCRLSRSIKYSIVNAWYDPTVNSFFLPPGILTEPIFEGDFYRDLPILGIIIGHEIGHSIDNNGRFFDDNGNILKDTLWSKRDEMNIKKAMDCISKKYGHPCGRNDYGYNTMGENIADMFGVKVAHAISKKYNRDSRTKNKDDIFYPSFAKLWCSRITKKKKCELVGDDVHAIPSHRVNRVLSNFIPFLSFYDCKVGDKMYNDKVCAIY